MNYLEDIIVVLSDKDDGSVQYSNCKRVAQKFKRKRSANKNDVESEEDSIEGKPQEKRRSPRLNKDKQIKEESKPKSKQNIDKNQSSKDEQKNE